jgi:hypothetical protein
MAGYRKAIRSSQKGAFRSLSDMGDTGAGLSSWQNISPEYRPNIEQAYKGLGDVVSGIGNYSDPTMAAARQTATDFLSGQDFGAGLDSYTKQMMDYVNKEVLPAATFSRMGRGSALSNALSRSLSESTGNIVNQGATLAGQRMGIAADMAQFLPQMALQEQQAKASGLGSLAEGYRGYSGELTNLNAQNQLYANQIRQQEYQNKLNALSQMLGFGPIQSGAGAFLSGLGNFVGGAAGALGGAEKPWYLGG